MNKRIAVLNVLLYAGTFFFLFLSRKDPSSSLGHAFFIIFLWVLLLLLLIALLLKKAIPSRKIVDRIGIFTATPVLLIIAGLFFPRSLYSSTEWQFLKGNYRYKVKTYYFRNSSKVARIEYYRIAESIASTEPDPQWIKDSTWIVFSESGDTIKTTRYR